MPYVGFARVMLAVGLALVIAVLAADAAGPQGPMRDAADWKAVEQALGHKGQMQSGEVFRVGLPRTDLNVTVQSVHVKPSFALGSYAAFHSTGGGVMVMGDLVLRDEEVPEVMARLLERGIDVTALHNHLNEMSPHVMYLHFGARGQAVTLARALREALGPVWVAPAGGASSAAERGPEIDVKQVEAVLGRSGSVRGGVFQVSVPRAETIRESGEELPPAMGLATAFNFQPTGNGRAAITGDFVLIAREVNPVARTLREHGIQVTAIHNHALAEAPRLFYMHFWGQDDAVKLARGLRAALDRTNSVKAERSAK